MKIKFTTINIILMCMTFYELSIVPHLVYIGFKYMVVLWLFIAYIKVAKKIGSIIILASLYGAITFTSSFMNRMGVNTIIASLVFGLQIVDIFLVSESYLLSHTIKEYARLLFNIFFVMLICTDLLMLVVHYNFSSADEYYLIGNKFVVSYVHCFASALAYMQIDQKERFIRISCSRLKLNGISRSSFAVLFSLFSILICMRVTCSTGMIVNIVLMLMMLLFSKGLKQVVADGKIMVFSTVVMNFLLYGTYSILSNSFFERFVYQTLGKSISWTGRLKIWAVIFDLILEKPLLGYGYYNTVIIQVLGFGNAQNGVLKFLLDAGILGLLTYATLVWKSFKCVGEEEVNRMFPLVAFFYVMILASAIEINLTHMIVFLSMAMAYSGTISNKIRTAR